MLEWIQFVGIALGITSLTFIMATLLLRRSPRDGRLPETDDEVNPTSNLVLGEFTTALSTPAPSYREKAPELAQELRSAGFYRPSAVLEYRAVRNLLVLLALLATGSLALLVPQEQMLLVLAGGLAITVLAFSLPRVYIALRSRSRSRAIERGLPLAIDLLILCLTAGQNLLSALLLVARQIRRNHPVLAQELTIAHQQAELHSLEQALHQWADRVRLPEVRNLVMLLIQSERLGADAAVTLTELAHNFRITARQRAEAAANRTSFWMLFPSVTCFWVAGAIILIGPAYLEYFQYQRRAAEMVNQSMQTIHKASSPSSRNSTPAAVPAGRTTP